MFPTFERSLRERNSRLGVFPDGAGPFGAFPSTAAVPRHRGLVPSRRSTWSLFSLPALPRTCDHRFQAADLKVLLHSRIRCGAGCCHHDVARCSLGLVSLRGFGRFVCSVLRRAPSPSGSSRRTVGGDVDRAGRHPRTRSGSGRPKPTVHSASRSLSHPGGWRWRRGRPWAPRFDGVGRPLPPLPRPEPKTAWSLAFAGMTRTDEPPGHPRWSRGRDSAGPKLCTARPPRRGTRRGPRIRARRSGLVFLDAHRPWVVPSVALRRSGVREVDRPVEWFGLGHRSACARVPAVR